MISATLRHFLIVSVALLIIFNRPNEVSCGNGKEGEVSASGSQNAATTEKDSEPDSTCTDLLAKFGFKGDWDADCAIFLDAFKYSDFVKDHMRKKHEEQDLIIMVNILRSDADELARPLVEGSLIFRDYDKTIKTKFFNVLKSLSFTDHMKYEEELLEKIAENELILPEKILDQYNDIKVAIRNMYMYELAEHAKNESILKEYDEKFRGRKKEFEYLLNYSKYIYEKVGACTLKKQDVYDSIKTTNMIQAFCQNDVAQIVSATLQNE